MPVLTPARRKALKQFELAFQRAAHKLGRHSKEARVAEQSVKSVPIRVFDRAVLERKGSSVTMGSRDMTMIAVGNGPFPRIKAKSVINMPAQHLFYGNKLTFNGAATLAHELSHAPRNVSFLAKKLHMTKTQAEEFLADITSAAILREMGFPAERIVNHFKGRWVVYGKHFPKVMHLIGRAATGKKIGYKVRPTGLFGFLFPRKTVSKKRRKTILESMVGSFFSIFIPKPKPIRRGFKPSAVHKLTPSQLRMARKKLWTVKRKTRRLPLLREKLHRMH